MIHNCHASTSRTSNPGLAIEVARESLESLLADMLARLVTAGLRRCVQQDCCRNACPALLHRRIERHDRTSRCIRVIVPGQPRRGGRGFRQRRHLGIGAGRRFGTRTPCKPCCEVLLDAAIKHAIAWEARIVLHRCVVPDPACVVHAGTIVERGGANVGGTRGPRPLATGIGSSD
jgi:hypothetical protein